MVSVLGFGIAFLIILESAYFQRDFFSPIRVYVVSQCLTLAVAYLKLFSKMTDWQLLTWTVFLVGMGSFVMGGLSYSLVNERTSSGPLRYILPNDYRWPLHCVFAFVVFLFYLSAAIQLYFFADGFPLFSDKLSRIMGQEIGSILGYFNYGLMSSPLVVMMFGLASFKKSNPHVYLRWFARFMVVTQIGLMVLFHPARNTLFMAIGFLVLFWNYLRKPISSWGILAGIMLLIGLFVLMGTVRSQYSSGSLAGIGLKNAIMLPYKYIANNFWNLDYALNPPDIMPMHPHTYGFDHFAGGTDYVIGDRLRMAFGWDNMFNKSIMKLKGYNTINYLWEIYKDFGYFGVSLIPFLWGVLSTHLYRCLTDYCSPRNLMLYTLLILIIGLWWFNIMYKNGLYWLWAGIILLTAAVCSTTRISRKGNQGVLS